MALLNPLPCIAAVGWWFAGFCPVVPQYHEKELSMRICTWHLVFLEGFQTPLPSFHIYSNSISIILPPSFTRHPCLHSCTCQEFSPARSQLVHRWSCFPLIRSVGVSMVGPIHLVCTLVTFSPLLSYPSPPLSPHISLPPAF